MILFKSLFAWIVENPFVLVMILIAGLIGAVASCESKTRKLRATQQDLHVSGVLVSKLQEESTALKTTINTATQIKKVNYENLEKELAADSLHADTLSVDQLERENDSLLTSNRQYVRNRAAKRNQPAVEGLRPNVGPK
ncbi:hypothetical protein GO755_29680 [Spirosoma sp. HMF4905]|uniref:Uncharacterized protein n=1 Tax=Spirosoma arboris TaxID=2682092 RepID=A0A7K1SKG0_9BACT|nr:hypothetical protein [Spirosoma arboris]MVM34238.1 hypothetical protein [Spirosoma arboris]